MKNTNQNDRATAQWKVRQGYDNGEPCGFVVHDGDVSLCDVCGSDDANMIANALNAHSALMTNSKYPWPNVRIGTTPEMRYVNEAVEVLDNISCFRHQFASLGEMADFAGGYGCLEMALTLREYGNLIALSGRR